jgi:hypothetical protein
MEGPRAAVAAMLKSPCFYAKLGEDMRQLGLVALAGSVTVFFPTDGLWHPVYGAMLLITSVLSYASGSYLTFRNKKGDRE